MSSNLPSGPPSQSRPPPSTPSTNILTDPPVPIPTFNVHLVLPFSISPTIFSLPNPEGGQKPGGQGRAEAEGEIKESYKRLVETLHGAGLRVTARRNEKGDEVLLMVGAGGRRIAELAARERREDFLHSLPSQTRLTPYPTSASPHQTPDPENKYLESIPRADQIRYLKELILTNSLQGGLGITPGEGHWRRVRSCLALHDEQANHAWVTSWLTQRWYVGLNKTLGDQDQQIILQNYGPSVAMYFSFLSFYTTSLLPLSVIGTFFWLGSKGVYGYIATLIGLETWAYTGGPAESGYGWSFSPLYSLLLCLWGIAVSEGWRIKQRKLSVSYGTYRISNVSRLRSQYLASLPGNAGFDAPATTANHALHDSHSVRGDPTFLAREGKIVVGVLVVMGLGLGLAGLLSGIFLFEAFLSKLYDGPGKQVLGLVPTLMFVGVVPNVLAFYHSISDKLTNWENHPTKSSHRDSLTVKTFALNAIVAYLGLFLSAYVYVPFGEIIMSYFSDRLFHHTDVPVVQAEKTGMGPKIDIGARTGIKADRLVGQVFAYTVTNQAINAFTELGLPYLKQYYAQYKGEKRDKESGKKTGLELKRVGHEGGPEEKRFLDKVEKELGLVEYSNFTDYAEMITQFGYITVWSVVWPLAPLFALINNWVELRSDAAKICTQVRRPVAERVESIGPWLHVMSFITWLSFLTTCTLCYLFRPNLDMPAWDQSINPSTNRTTFSNYGTGFLHAAIEDSLHANPNRTVAAGSAYLPTWVARSGAMRTVLPMAIPTMFVALLASHGYLVVRLAGRMVAEKLFWESSAEAKAIVLSEEAAKKSFLEGKYDDGLSTLDGRDQGYGGGGQPGGVRLGAPLGGNDGPFSGYTTTLGAHPGYTTTGGSASGFWRGVDEGYEAIAAALKNE